MTYQDLRLLTKAPAMRFLFLFAAFADRDPVVGDAITRFYRENTKAWGAVYAGFFRTHGLKLRPGLSLNDFTILLSAVADGLALRMVGDHATLGFNREGESRRHSLLGTAVLALALACVDPGDGQTLEEAADAMVGP
ncbi:MAG: hypothetical protein ACRDTC_19235 [Pseudonocardiaceae bacterium]